MALDEPKDTDDKLEGEGYCIVADKEMVESFGGLALDFEVSGWGAGFRITPTTKADDSCGTCSC